MRLIFLNRTSNHNLSKILIIKKYLFSDEPLSNLQAPIWKLYYRNNDENTATCKICYKTRKVKKGRGCYPLYSHMKCHPYEYRLAMIDKAKWMEARYQSQQFIIPGLDNDFWLQKWYVKIFFKFLIFLIYFLFFFQICFHI